MTEYTQTLHSKMKLHHERHIFKRGNNKGDAPAGKRYKTHYLIIDRKDHMALRFWNTDILKAYPDGSITIDCGGWSGNPTTKTHLNQWLRGHHHFCLYSDKIMSHSQLSLYTPKNIYRYYDGITFDADGAPTTPLKGFYAKRIDKDEVAELNKALDENGFREMFKVLWGAVTPDECPEPHMQGLTWWAARDRSDVFAMPDVYAEQWRPMVASFAFEVRRSYDMDTQTIRTTHIKRTPSATWSLIMRWVKDDMHKTIETEVFAIPVLR
jgi:hypothetical protein